MNPVPDQARLRQTLDFEVNKCLHLYLTRYTLFSRYCVHEFVLFILSEVSECASATKPDADRQASFFSVFEVNRKMAAFINGCD